MRLSNKDLSLTGPLGRNKCNQSIPCFALSVIHQPAPTGNSKISAFLTRPERTERMGAEATALAEGAF